MSLKPVTATYDAEYDILHVRVGDCSDAFDDEDYPGVFIRRSESTEAIVGLTVMDFMGCKCCVRRFLHRFDWDAIGEMAGVICPRRDRRRADACRRVLPPV